MSLEQLREEIDAIDEQLVKLFVKRMGVSAKVAEYKKQNGLAVQDSSREGCVLERVATLAGKEWEAQVQDLYVKMLEISRAYQNSRL